MSRACRLVVAAAGLLGFAGAAAAQPPGFGGGGFGRDRGPDRKADAQADEVKALEEKLAKLKEAEEKLVAELRRLKAAPKPPAPPAGPRGGFSQGGVGGLSWFIPGWSSGQGGEFGIERMSAEEIKELIGKLQKVLDEKTKGERGKAADKPAKDKEAASQDEILKRLDRLSRELDEIRRAIKK